MDKLNIIKRNLPKVRKIANPCRLCRHRCAVNRREGEKGFCRAGSKPAVYSYSPHYGEEPPLSGGRGSGAVFFTHCSMKCVYCQNYQFSQEADRRESREKSREEFEEIETRELAERMLELKKLGCHNINLVTPTHYAAEIVAALGITACNSLDLPIVYNTGGYDSPELIKLLDGIVDIYMPDMRYSEDKMAEKFSSAPGYVENNRAIVKEMFRQAGVLKLDKDGIAKKGVIVRLLILPDNISGTIETLRFLKEEVSEDIYLSVMSQYYPTYKAENYPEIARRINRKEHREIVNEVEKLGFSNGWIQACDTDPRRFLGTKIKPN